MLDRTLSELWDVVDGFVISEVDYSFSGMLNDGAGTGSPPSCAGVSDSESGALPPDWNRSEGSLPLIDHLPCVVHFTRGGRVDGRLGGRAVR